MAKRFFANTSSTYDTVVNVATFGRDAAWKRAMLELVPAGDYKVLDLACGTGILTFALAGRVSEVVGVDLMHDNSVVALAKKEERSAKNTMFITSAAEAVPLRDEYFDFVTASYLSKYCDLDLVASESARVLRRNGMLVMHDFTYPRNAAMRGLWKTYFKLLRLVGVFTPSWSAVFNELDHVIQQSNWVGDLTAAMRKHGFGNIQCKYMTAGTAAIVWGRLS